MRWSLARLLSLMPVCALGVFLVSQYGTAAGSNDVYISFGFYLALLATATVAAFSSPPLWARFWATFAVFGWTYLAFVLLRADPQTDRVIPLWFKKPTTSKIGIMCGLFAAFLSLIIPGPFKRTTGPDNTQPEHES